MAEETRHKRPKTNPGDNITPEMEAALQKAWSEQEMRNANRVRSSTENAMEISRQGGIPQLPKNDPSFIDRANTVEKAYPIKTKKPKRLDVDPPPNWEPAEGQDDAKAIAGEWAKRAREKILANSPKRQNDPKRQYYLECHKCKGPGIFFVEEPAGSVPASNWFSSYKAANQYWPPEVHPECQCCMEDNVQTKLRVLWYDKNRKSWGPYKRMVKSIEKVDITEAPKTEEVPVG